jgi:aryl-alcohol dehydrogenase-like predicted oxidoreductase
VDRRVSWEELWEAFEVAVYRGKIGYVGSSNFAAWDLALAQAAAASRHFFGLVSEQHKFSLLCRLPELEVLPAARHLGIGVLAWSPLAGGILGGHALTNPGTRTAQHAQRIEALRPQLEAFSKLCREIGESEAAVALAWVLNQPAVTSVIIGPRTVEQLQQTLRATEIELDQETLNKLDEIFPGPGGEAPRAYAW